MLTLHDIAPNTRYARVCFSCQLQAAISIAQHERIQRGPGGSVALALRNFKICSFQERENPYFEQILGARPLVVKTSLGPPRPKSWIRPCIGISDRSSKISLMYFEHRCDGCRRTCSARSCTGSTAGTCSDYTGPASASGAHTGTRSACSCHTTQGWSGPAATNSCTSTRASSQTKLSPHDKKPDTKPCKVRQIPSQAKGCDKIKTTCGVSCILLVLHCKITFCHCQCLNCMFCASRSSFLKGMHGMDVMLSS